MLSVIPPSQPQAMMPPAFISGAQHQHFPILYQGNASSTSTSSRRNSSSNNSSRSRVSSSTTQVTPTDLFSTSAVVSHGLEFTATASTDLKQQQQTFFNNSCSKIPSSYQSNFIMGTPQSQSRRSSAPTTAAAAPAPTSMKKDYSTPLFVDCSIEYDLSNAPKIPKNSAPILMIDPRYQKRQQQIQHQMQQQQRQQQQQQHHQQQQQLLSKAPNPSFPSVCNVKNCQCVQQRRYQMQQEMMLRQRSAVKRSYRTFQQQQQQQIHSEQGKALRGSTRMAIHYLLFQREKCSY